MLVILDGFPRENEGAAMRPLPFATVAIAVLLLAATFCQAAVPANAPTYDVQIHTVVPADPAKFTAYIESLNAPALFENGVGHCLLDSDHPIAAISTAKLQELGISEPNKEVQFAAVADRAVGFNGGNSVRVVVTRDVAGKPHSSFDQVPAGITANLLIQSLPGANAGESSFRLRLELHDAQVRHDQTVQLQGLNLPTMGGFMAKAELNMRPGQILLMRGQPFETAIPDAIREQGGALDAHKPRPLYIVTVQPAEHPNQPVAVYDARAAKDLPSACSAMIDVIYIETHPDRWKAADLPPLSELLQLPELAPGQVGFCNGQFDSPAARLLYTDGALGGHVDFSRATTSTGLIDAGQARSLEYSAGRLGGTITDATTEGRDGVTRGATQTEFHCEFESLDQDGAVFRYGFKKESIERKPGRKWGKAQPLTKIVIQGEGRVKLRVGETRFHRPTITYSHPKKSPPVDAIYALRLNKLSTPSDGPRPRDKQAAVTADSSN